MSSSRCWRTSCGTRWRRFGPRRSSSARGVSGPRLRKRARHHRAPDSEHDPADRRFVERRAHHPGKDRLATGATRPDPVVAREPWKRFSPKWTNGHSNSSCRCRGAWSTSWATRLGSSRRSETFSAMPRSLRNGSGRIWFSAELKRTPKGDDVFVYVRDEGIGIQPDTLPHVFELFKQGGASSAPGAGPRRRPGSCSSDCGTAWRPGHGNGAGLQSRQRVCGTPAASLMRPESRL